MDLIGASLRKPVSVLVLAAGIVVFSVLAVKNMAIDIFPEIGNPAIYVAQPYGGLSPEQMEGFLSSVLEQHFIYVAGVKSMESRSVQGMSVIKLEFHEGTDMAEAMGQVVAQVNRAGGKMPPGTIAPFVVRQDAGNVPVGQLVFSSSTRSLSEIQDLAVTRIRPMFSGLPGVSSPPPVGGNQKTIVVSVNPEKLQSFGLSTEDVVSAIAENNRLSPAGSIRSGGIEYAIRTNAIVRDIQELGRIPLHKGNGPTVYVKDLATIEMASDIATGLALVNGQRSVYIPVNKRAGASTWTVVKNLKEALPAMRRAVPDDIEVTYAFDQSGYVVSALRNILAEGLIAALLIGLMVVLFLGSARSGIVVVTTIPLSLLFSVVFLALTGQTFNIMTLAGLALSVGVLVDEASVTIENIHRHIEMGKSLSKAVADGAREIVVPKLLIVFCLLAVFVPSFFMSGVARSMFVPLSLAVGAAMIGSFVLSQTLVPVASAWLLRKNGGEGRNPHGGATGRYARFARWYAGRLSFLLRWEKLAVPLYLLGTASAAVLMFLGTGTEIFPKTDSGQIKMRLLAPEGSRIEATEALVLQVLDKIHGIVGEDMVEVSSAYVGTIPSAYPASAVSIWNSGPHAAFLLVKIRNGAALAGDPLKERIREFLAAEMPGMTVSFEPGDIVEQVMGMGASTPVEIALTGKDIAETARFAKKIQGELKKIPALRDVNILQPLNSPTLQIDIDRQRAGKLGLSAAEVNQSLVSATSSSRFTRPVFWLDMQSGNNYQVQVEVPQYRMDSPDEISNVFMPRINGFNSRLRDLAQIGTGTSQGEVVRINQQRAVLVTANIHGSTLGGLARQIDKALAAAGEPPRGMVVLKRGQLETLADTMDELKGGLLVALTVVMLMLAVNFQSFRVALATLSTLPAVAVGVLSFLWLAGASLNIQSYLGLILAFGVSVANAILFVTFAEDSRRVNGSSLASARMAGESRLRPILMTAISMIVGLLPLALGGGQTGPLGIAVIGGMICSTLAILFFLPPVYARLMLNVSNTSVSLDPYDKNSAFYEEN